MLISFLFLHENIHCGYSLEAPRWGASNEYPQHMFSWRNKKNIMWIPPLICSYAVCLGMFAHPLGVIDRLCSVNVAIPGPSCSKLTMSLVNDSLKFTLSDTRIRWNFCWKNVSSFCSAKATHILSAKNIRILYIESAKIVNEMTLNELLKLMTLWTTGPWSSILFFNYKK